MANSNRRTLGSPRCGVVLDVQSRLCSFVFGPAFLVRRGPFVVIRFRYRHLGRVYQRTRECCGEMWEGAGFYGRTHMCALPRELLLEVYPLRFLRPRAEWSNRHYSSVYFYTSADALSCFWPRYGERLRCLNVRQVTGQYFVHRGRRRSTILFEDLRK